MEFIAENGRFYPFDGKGGLQRSETETYDQCRKFENGYNKVHADSWKLSVFQNGSINFRTALFHILQENVRR